MPDASPTCAAVASSNFRLASTHLCSCSMLIFDPGSPESMQLPLQLSRHSRAVATQGAALLSSLCVPVLASPASIGCNGGLRIQLCCCCWSRLSMVQRAPGCRAVLGGIKVGCPSYCWVRCGSLSSVGDALGAWAGRVRHVTAGGMAAHPEGRSERAGCGGILAGVLPCGWGQASCHGSQGAMWQVHERQQGSLSWAGSTAPRSCWLQGYVTRRLEACCAAAVAM